MTQDSDVSSLPNPPKEYRNVRLISGVDTAVMAIFLPPNTFFCRDVIGNFAGQHRMSLGERPKYLYIMALFCARLLDKTAMIW